MSDFDSNLTWKMPYPGSFWLSRPKHIAQSGASSRVFPLHSMKLGDLKLNGHLFRQSIASILKPCLYYITDMFMNGKNNSYQFC